MSEMIERVARRLCVLDGRDPDKLEPGNVPYEGLEIVDGQLKGGPAFRIWRSYVPRAHGVIEAMREPTEAMAAAGADHPFADDVLGTWHAMIDAALTAQ